MKDKLRELAERWKIYGSHMTGHECAAELLAILDADGDGGAVGEWRDPSTAPVSTPLEQVYFLARCPNDNWSPGAHVHFACFYGDAGMCRPVGTNGARPFNGWMPVPSTDGHPARSGVVIDEWVGEIECCDAKGFWLILADDCPFVPGQKVTITATKGERHEH